MPRCRAPVAWPLSWALVLMTAATAAVGRGMPQAQEQGATGGPRRLHQAPQAAASVTSGDSSYSSFDSGPELAELNQKQPSWLTSELAMPLPSDPAVPAVRGPRALLMCLFILALLGVAVAAWVGLRAWHRSWQRQRQRQQHRHDLESLLWAQQQQQQLATTGGYQPVGTAAEPGSPSGLKDEANLQRSWGQGGSGVGKRGGSSSPTGAAAPHQRLTAALSPATAPAAAAPAAAEGAPARAGPHRAASSERRTRLAALLAAHLGTRRTRSLGKLPPEALPAALTHQLASPEGAAVQAKQRRRRRHRERRAAAAASDGKPKRSLQSTAAEQRRPPAPEELQLALQQQLLPPRASGRQHGTAAARLARSVPPPPGTPAAASRGAAVLSPPEAGPAAQRSTGGSSSSGAATQRSTGGSSSSSGGGASLWASRGSRAAGGRTSTAARGSHTSSELAGSSSAVESVLEWLSSGDVCGESGGERLEQLEQPGQPGLLAGLQFATSSSQRLQELGSGPHGVTYRGRLSGRHVAVKVVEPPPGFNPAALQPWVVALQAASHPHILPLKTAAVKGGLLLLVSELVHGGCLQAALQQPEQRRQLAWAARGREAALAVAEALCYLHDTLHIAHGNLTASNVLLGDSNRILVADAGLSALLGSPPTAQHAQPTVQPAPAAPAALAGDVRSFGELLATMLAPQPGAPPDCPAVVAALVEACRSPDPYQRPTAAHILRCLRQEAGRPATSATP